MSAWTTLRNAVEAIVEPEIAAAITLGQAILSDSEAAAAGNVTKSFDAAVSAFESTPGTLEIKALAAGAAFIELLVGYEVAIVKKDTSATTAA